MTDVLEDVDLHLIEQIDSILQCQYEVDGKACQNRADWMLVCRGCHLPHYVCTRCLTTFRAELAAASTVSDIGHVHLFCTYCQKSSTTVDGLYLIYPV